MTKSISATEYRALTASQPVHWKREVDEAAAQYIEQGYLTAELDHDGQIVLTLTSKGRLLGAALANDN